MAVSNRGEDEVVWALYEQDGKEVWSVRIAPAHTRSFPQSKEGPSATPTVDGDGLYVMGLVGNVVCLQAADCKIVWQRIWSRILVVRYRLGATANRR